MCQLFAGWYVLSNGVTCEAPVLARAANKQEETDDPLKWHCVNLPSLLVPSSQKWKKNKNHRKYLEHHLYTITILYQHLSLHPIKYTSMFQCPFVRDAKTNPLDSEILLNGQVGPIQIICTTTIKLFIFKKNKSFNQIWDFIKHFVNISCIYNFSFFFKIIELRYLLLIFFI